MSERLAVARRAAAIGIGWWMMRDGEVRGAGSPPDSPPAVLEEAPAKDSPPPPPAPPEPPVDAPSRDAAPPTSGVYSPAMATSVIRVRTRLEGTPPRMRPVRFDADPECGKQQSTAVPEETIVSRDGLLANAVVFVSRGAERWTFRPPEEPVVLDQRGCMYVPHVFTVMAGQPVHIRNSDPVMHNVHGIPRVNREFNRSQLKGAKEIETRFEKAELGIIIKCDVHGWMRSFAGVFDHPFHAVTDGDGSAVLRLPPGEYEVAVWHEKLPAPEAQRVRVGEGATSDAEFRFVVK
ncbi:MAG: hypothetical protein HUU06_10975 [Planctomycetaceae bacterium]|nr:hypothetical protein [Planctomycetaceae bacterium]